MSHRLITEQGVADRILTEDGNILITEDVVGVAANPWRTYRRDRGKRVWWALPMLAELLRRMTE